MAIANRPVTCVVICYWIGESSKNLFYLLDQMLKIDAGAPFSVVVVVNGGDERPLILPKRYDALDARVINRINHGYNIEAWDIGWRSCSDHENFLFLQSECFIKAPNWIADFEFRMNRDYGIGLLGEQAVWEQRTWQFIRESTDRDLGDSCWPKDEPLHPIDSVKTEILKQGLPLTDLGTYLNSIVHFTSKRVLDDVGGYPLFGPTYRQAVASEIAFSRLIESKGYRLSKIRDRDFSIIGHRQATQEYTLKMKIRTQAGKVLRQLGLKR